VTQPHESRLAGALLVQTVATGLIDAVSYLALGHVFTANMTGNVVFLAFAVAGAPGLSIPRSAVSLGAFLAGAVAGGRLAARLGAVRNTAGSLRLLLWKPCCCSLPRWQPLLARARRCSRFTASSC